MEKALERDEENVARKKEGGRMGDAGGLSGRLAPRIKVV